MVGEIRRSGRKRKVNTKYHSDTWNDLLEAVGPLSEDEASRVLNEADDSGEEFVAPDEPAQDSEHGEDMSVDEGSDRNSSPDADEEGRAGDAVDDGSGDDVHLTSTKTRPSSRMKSPINSKLDVAKLRGVGTTQRLTSTTAPQTHTRGLKAYFKRSSRDKLITATFGNHLEDIIPLRDARDKWFDEITLPSRESDHKGVGGMSHSFYVPEEIRDSIATKGWDWYFEGGGYLTFQERQVMQPLSLGESKIYTKSTSAAQDFVMGESAHQKHFNLAASQAFNANQAFGSSNRTAWIINAGGPAHNLGWAPNQSGPEQYLAISTFTKAFCTHSASNDQSATASAFKAADPSPSTIQIWSFRTKKSTENNSTIDMSLAPRLGLVLCIDWGHIKEFKWCPSPQKPRPSHPHPRSTREIYLGMLALITSDGKIRVLDISYPDTTHPSTTQYLYIKSAAFESRPPNTICTCVTWLSPREVSAGCSNGYLAVWDLSANLTNSGSNVIDNDNNAAPVYYNPTHITYISSVTSCYPSRPHLILTNSPDGYHRLTDLRNPSFDHVYSIRSRVITSNAIWHDQSQHAFGSDDTYTLRGFNVRAFYQSVLVSHEESAIHKLAASEVHPALLIGYADGGVGVYNPLRRLMHSRGNTEHYRQLWWRHEWRRGKPISNPIPTTSSPTPTTNTTPAQDYPTGLTRLQTGFAIVALKTSTSSAESSTGRAIRHVRGPAAAVAARTTSDGTIYTTIYEEKSGVKCIAWNQNFEVGGWAAVGWGTGLVVVEDLCWR